jgi:Domain of unknown function DUF11
MDTKLESLKDFAKENHPLPPDPKSVFVPSGNVEVIDYVPIAQPGAQSAQPEVTKPTKKPNPVLDFFKKFPWVLPVVSVLIVALLGTVLWMVFNTAPQTKNDKVEVTVEAPKEVPIGSTREWVITVKNNNPVQIFDTRATLLLDQNFKYQRDTSTNASFDQKSTTYFLKAIAAGESRIIRFEAQILGAIQETSTLQVKVQFSPQSTKNNEVFEVTSNKYITTIISSDINASISKETELVEVNSDTTLTFKFENISDKDIENIRVRGLFPGESDFLYRSSKLDQGSIGIVAKPTEGNNVWVIEKLPKKAIFALSVTGKVQSNAKTELPFTFDIASLDANKEWKKILEKTDTIKSTPQSLAINTYINGIKEFFTTSSTVEVVVEYENKSTKSISGIEINSTINDPAGLLDYTKVAVTTGTPNITNKTLIWKGANFSELVSLSPGARGALRYTVPVKSKELALNSNLEQDKYTLQPVAEVKQENKPSITATSTVVYKMAGGLVFNQKSEEIKDVKQTVFGNDTGNFKVVRVTWEFSTLQNQLTALEAKTSTSLTSLFEPVFNPQSISPADYLDKLLYTAAGDIVLRQDTVPNYLGVSKSKLVIAFDIKIPESSAINGNYGSVVVLNKTTITAKDAITAQEYKAEVAPFRFADVLPK